MPSIQTTVNFPVRKTRSVTKNAAAVKNQDHHVISKHSVSTKKNYLRKFDRECKVDGDENRENRGEQNSELNKFTAGKRNSPRAFCTPRTPKKSPSIDTHLGEFCSPSKRAKEGSEDYAPNILQTPETGKISPLRTKNISQSEPAFSCYQYARQVLHTSVPSRILCREKEILEIADFLDSHLAHCTSGSMYISGAPGTGKTCCLTQILEAKKLKQNFKSIFVNCMSFRSSTAIYNKISSELGCMPNSSSQRDVLKSIEKKLTDAGSMVVLVLDEIDNLDSKNQEVLYTLFDWPRQKNSRLLLIGIANALDLTERVLPRLQALGCQPPVLHFKPYTRQQIVTILDDRLKEIQSTGTHVIHPMALQLCARKVAACAGDIRKALDVCRRSVEMVENHVKHQQILKPTADDGCNPGSPRKSLTSSSFPVTPVSMQHISTVLHEVYGSRVLSSGSDNSAGFSAMPLQHKILLCSLLLVLRNVKVKEVPVGKLQEIWTRLCKKHHVSEFDQSEFMGICTLVESQGIIGLKKHKESRLTKITLKIDEKEVEYVIQDKMLLASVLSDKTVLKK
ncbi:cell division cycle 6 [Tachypleus tridentatus]|uniref:cell division cycle 6 n=1 Tax=Tachypleus tridentatus TaxID=6853 RepID=UPI003FD3563C